MKTGVLLTGVLLTGPLIKRAFFALELLNCEFSFIFTVYRFTVAFVSDT